MLSAPPTDVLSLEDSVGSSIVIFITPVGPLISAAPTCVPPVSSSLSDREPHFLLSSSFISKAKAIFASFIRTGFIPRPFFFRGWGGGIGGRATIVGPL